MVQCAAYLPRKNRRCKNEGIYPSADVTRHFSKMDEYKKVYNQLPRAGKEALVARVKQVLKRDNDLYCFHHQTAEFHAGVSDGLKFLSDPENWVNYTTQPAVATTQNITNPRPRTAVNSQSRVAAVNSRPQTAVVNSKPAAECQKWTVDERAQLAEIERQLTAIDRKMNNR
jgi:hypothetical protein